MHFSFYLLTGIGALISVFVSGSWLLHMSMARLLESPPVNGTTFDFIVVGSGSAGSVVAGRLAEAGHNVLLLEAGGPSHWMQGIPNFIPFFIDSWYVWPHYTTRQPNCVMLNERKVFVPTGKSLGGTSMINYMVYMRGNRLDYDEWELQGNSGWGYEDVLPYFKSGEKFHGSGPAIDEEYHGRNGRMGVMNLKHMYPVNHVINQAWNESGYVSGDLNGEHQTGGFYPDYGHQVTQENSWRLGSYRSFVEPLLNNPESVKGRIEVVTFAEVDKLLFGADSSKVVGVTLERFGERLSYFASKEVIVSAGTLGSPKLLMLSGIGPKEHLQDLDIQVKADLPVGENLHDHVITLVTFYTDQQLTATPWDGLLPSSLYSFLSSGEGPLSDNTQGSHGLVRTPLMPKEDPRPDIQMHHLPFGAGFDYGAIFSPSLNFDQETYDEIFGPHLGRPAITVVPTLLRPKSRGNLRLASNNPKDFPLVDPRYLAEDSDINTLIEGVKMAAALENTEAFKTHGLRAAPVNTLHCADHVPFSQSYWRCYVLSTSGTIYHLVGTCAMGPKGVVDERLRVYVIRGLRVVDASVMPTIVGGNTHAPTTMIGEKAAAMINEDWSKEEKGKKNKEEKEKKQEL